MYLLENGVRKKADKTELKGLKDLNVSVNAENVGFARGVNRLLKQAYQDQCDMIVCLNNDTVVKPEWLQEIVQAAENLTRRDLLGCVILKGDLSNIVWFAGGRLYRPWLIPQYRHNHYEVVHAESPHISGIAAVILAIIFKAKSLVEVRVDYQRVIEFRYQGFSQRVLSNVFRFLTSWTLHHASGVVGNCRTTNEILTKTYNLTPLGYYNPGVSPFKTSRRLPLTPHIFGFLGRLELDKGPADFIALVDRLGANSDSLTFLIGGTGSLRLSLRHPRVILLGQVDRWQFFNQIDVLVNCTQVNAALEMVIPEAGSLGIPTVAYGHPETIIPNISGLIVPTGNIKALAVAVKRLLQDHDLYQVLSSGARRHAQNYLFSQQVKNLASIYVHL